MTGGRVGKSHACSIDYRILHASHELVWKGGGWLETDRGRERGIERERERDRERERERERERGGEREGERENRTKETLSKHLELPL